MNGYPESLFNKLFSFIDISNPLTRENIKAIQDRGTLVYKSAVFLPYLIAGIAIVILIMLYKKWRTPHSLRLFSQILLLGGFSIWGSLGAAVIEGIMRLLNIRIFFVDSESLTNLPMAYIPLVAPLLGFPLVIYLLSRYAFACKGKIMPLVYVAIGLQSLISFAVAFWDFNLLAKMQLDKINKSVYFEIKSYSMTHILTAIACYASLIVLLYLLWKPLRKIAQSSGVLIAGMYNKLSVMVTIFLIVWLGITTCIHAYKIKDIVPLWMHYGSVITPHLFYAFFAVYFMHALRRIKG